MLHLLFQNHSFDADWCFPSFKEYLYPHQKAVVLPFAFSDALIHTPAQWQAYYNKQRGPYCRRTEAAFARYGIRPENITWVNFFEDTKETALEKVRSADILYLCSGVPELLMERLQRLQLDHAVEAHGGTLMGEGAGALVQLMQYHRSSGKQDDGFAYRKGLRLLTGFDLELSYCRAPAQLEAIRRVRSEYGLPVYALSEQGALIVQNGRIETVGDTEVFY